jgi:hypothetical protein
MADRHRDLARDRLGCVRLFRKPSASSRCPQRPDHAVILALYHRFEISAFHFPCCFADRFVLRDSKHSCAVALLPGGFGIGWLMMPYSTPEKRREGRQRTYPQNRDRILNATKRHRKRNPDRYRHNALKRRYGITIEQFDAIVDAQKGQCALCQEPLKLGTKSVHVDHCHETGRVRGVLCARCNLGIGRFGDTIQGPEKAIAYLRRSSPSLG